jgi:excisionase family DNA binding protein
MLTRMLTTQDVAAYLQVDPNTVYRWCREGKIGAVKVGREWRIDQRDLSEFLRARRNSSPLPRSSLKSIFRNQLLEPEHLMVMLTNPEKVFELEVEFFQVALEQEMPIFKGCWWQQPDEVRHRYVEAGLPVEKLEKQGRFVIHNFWGAYSRAGAQGVLDLWNMQADVWRGETFWGSGSHLLDQWKDNWDSFFDYESRLHTVLCQLPGVVLCPCVTTPTVAEGTTHLLDLTAHHHGVLILTKQSPMLMRLAMV